MRFYLLYKNHGLYDPVLDDTELTYVPIPQEEYEASNLQQVTSHLNDEEKQTLKQNNGKVIEATKLARETIKSTLEDKVRLKLKDAFQNINIEELPPTARFKLPISDDYDPEGKKMSKLQKFYDKNILSVDLTKVSEQIRQEVNEVAKNIKEMRQNLVNEEIEEEKTMRQHEMTKEEYKYSDKNQEDISLKTIQETASQIVDISINKAVDVAAEIKQKLNVSSERKQFKKIKTESDVNKETTYLKIHSFKDSRFEERQNKTYMKDTEKQGKDSKTSSSFDKKGAKKVSFSDILQEEETNEANEMKKIEIGENTEIGSRLTAEKRKLLTKQDIEEAIAPGTVRDRAAIFKKYNIMKDVIKKSDNKSDSKNRKVAASITARMRNINMAQQRVYSIGAQTILNIRRLQYPRCSEILLKTFWSKFTNVLVTLSKFTTVKPIHYFNDIKPEKTLERQEFERRDGELIVKSKLSGAKIAQIEGMKPVELTNKMDIVISELQRKSGIEEQLNKEEISQERSEYKIEDDIKSDYSENKSDVNEDFYQDNSYKYDNKKFHTFETTKTQTMEIREIKTEKHISEYKRSKVDSNIYKKENNENENITKTDTDLRETNERIVTTDDGKIIYVAIVEAHVYTNKDAIFEIHLRRLSENEKVIEKTKLTEQSDKIESIDKKKLYSEFDESRKQSLASTVLIEPAEEYSTEFESRPVKYIRSAADLEHVAKRIAVQNITQVIEPLLKLEAHKYDSSRHAHTIIEMPIRKTAEISNITAEEKQMYFQAQVFVQQKSYMSVEKPDKPIVEIKEIFVDEDETGIIEESKVIVEEPQSTIEEPVKSIAQTTELLINEEQITNIEAFEPIAIKPLPTIDIAAKSVALTSEPLVSEADLKLFDKPEPITKTFSAAIQKSSLTVAEMITTSSEFNSELLNISETRKELANIKMGENTATEVLQISLEEPIIEKIEAKSKNEQESRVIIEKTAVLPVAETSIILPEESSYEIPMTKIVDRKANINIEELKAAEILTVPIEEPKHESFEVPNKEEKLPQTLLQSCVLTIAQTLAVLPEGPKDENLEIPDVTFQQTKILMEAPLLIAAESIITLPGGPKEGSLEIDKIISAEPNIDFEEFNAALATIISPEEPIDDSFDIPKASEKVPQISMEGPRHTVAEIITVIPACPKDDNLEIIKPQEEKIQINYSELSSVETITIVPDEPKEDALDIPKASEKIPQTSMEGPLHTVAEIIAVIPASPLVANLDITKPEEEKIQINYNELRSVETMAIVPGEPKEDALDIPKVSEKIPQISMEGPLHTVAEIIAIIPASPIDPNLEITKKEEEKVQINYNELRSVETITIVPNEPKEDALDIQKASEKIPQTSMEGPLHTVAEIIAVIPASPMVANLDIAKPEEEKIQINYNEFRSLETIAIVPDEPKEDALDIPKVSEKIPQTSMEGPLHTVAEIIAIIPASPIDASLDITKPEEEKIQMNYNELKSVETIMTVPEELSENILDIPKITEKSPQMSMEGPRHTVAQTITIIPDSPTSGSLDKRIPSNEKIIVKYNELIPVEASTIIPEETIKNDLQLPKILEKHPQVTTQETKLNIAETFTIIPEEPKDDVFKVSKVSSKKARIDIQELKAAETKIILFEEKANENLKIPEVKQKTAIISTVEDLVTAKAKVPKLAIVDVSNEKRFEEIELNYTVELPKQEDEKVQEVFAEITITKQQTPPAEIFAEFEFNERKVDVSSDVSESIKLMNKHEYRQESMDVSYSHTIKDEIKRIMQSCRYEAEFIRSGSSSPITPIIEEYMFKLQCPLLRRYLEEVFQEATLKLKSKVQKTTIQNFDASLTLILQDIAMSRESEEVDIAMESMKYVSSSDMSVQNTDNQSLSTSVETNISSKAQSLHSGVAIASAVTKHAIETGIDVSMLTVEQESLAEAKLSAAKKSSSLKAKAATFESLQSKSSKIKSVEASYAHVENEATFVGHSLEANMGISMQNKSFAVSQKQETNLRKSVYAAEQSNQSSGVSIEEISNEESLRESSFSKAKSVAADKKLSLRTDMTLEPDDVRYYSPLSPPTVPQTPLVDEYVFRLEIPLPKESKFVPRDCSYSPDSIDEDIILKNGLIPHIKTKIYRILYSPPLPTPPTSPDKIIPIYGSGIKSSDKKDPNSSLFRFLS